MNDILQVQAITTYIGQFLILEDVTVNVPEGSVTVLLGRNGAGKTTTLRSIMGLLPSAQGKIYFAGKPLGKKPPYEIAQLGIGYVPEHRAIFRQLTVAENLKIAERRPGQLKEREEFIFDLFPDLKRLFHWPGGQLSGGQQQMLAIARALVPDNRLLLIDEPSEGLAPVIIEQLIRAIRQLSDSTTVLLVEQNFRVASQLSQYYTIIEDGKSVNHGLMSDLVQNTDLIQQYLAAA